MTVEAALRALVEASESYLARHPGPGVSEVRAGLAAARDRTYKPRRARHNAVVVAHLADALAAVRASEPELAQAITEAAPHLGWITYDGYQRHLIGEAFADGHAYATLVGEAGPFAAADFDFGLFLIAPNVLYRDRAHPAPELYAPLTGPHGWRFGPGSALEIMPAHHFVWNEPFRPHLTKIGPVPFLCLFGWTRDVNQPAVVVPADDWASLEALRLAS